MAEMMARKKGCQLNDGAVTAAAEEKEATDKIVKRSFFWLMPKEIFQFRNVIKAKHFRTKGSDFLR